MNKKERRLALATALQSAAADMTVIADFGALEAVSTQGLASALSGLGVGEGKKVLLIVNEANETVYLSGRNIPTLAINTAHAVQVRAGAGAPLAAVWCVVSAWGSAVPHMRIVLQHPPFSLPGPHTYTPAPPPALLWQVYDVLNADHILVEQGALAYLNEWFGGEEAAAAAEAAQ